MSSSEDEVREALEGKELELSDNVNDYDQGALKSKEKLGDKNLEAKQDFEKRLARMDYIRERDRKMQFGDKQAIAEYMQEASEIRQRLEQQKERQLVEYQLLQDEKKRLAKLSRITQADRDKEAEDIQKLERKRDKEIANIKDYFNASEEEWEEYIHNRHTAGESLARALITTSDNGMGYCCTLHKYQKVIESPNNDWELVASSFTSEPVENHFRKDPKPHLGALIEITNNKYEAKINERKQKTLEDKDVVFNKEIREIDQIKTRTDGDWASAGTKITKSERARIRRAEEEENERNRKIYRGLYS